VRSSIEAKGYVQIFTTLYSDEHCPADVKSVSTGSGWVIRRAIREWAATNGYADYVIFRATDYLRDLHGSKTYEFFARAALQRAEGEV
jgi:hypothetical protein